MEKRGGDGGGGIKGACSQRIESVAKGNKIGGGDAGSSMKKWLGTTVGVVSRAWGMCGESSGGRGGRERIR